ncbi:hypothetical protein [Ornithinicoccus hortensis]|uniref:Uncharacterized protein n=1 Tax=Ornithinicoccus hortensis TaxID=82346 RepID=A0A542YSF8_9MICO|nr:hypothetical protein [Ornithinicoccus hortensis]TQL51007.1 hypothetical protein FB467_2140 [Ornithinicoccus hortensis]
MSDEREMVQLLDRAVQEGPPLRIDAAAVVAAGRGRVRRRRLTGLGATVVLAGGVWLGGSQLAGGEHADVPPPAATGQVGVVPMEEGVNLLGHEFSVSLSEETHGELVLTQEDDPDRRQFVLGPPAGSEVQFQRTPAGVVVAVPGWDPGQPAPVDVQVRTSDGATRWVESTDSLVVQTPEAAVALLTVPAEPGEVLAVAQVRLADDTVLEEVSATFPPPVLEVTVGDGGYGLSLDGAELQRARSLPGDLDVWTSQSRTVVLSPADDGQWSVVLFRNQVSGFPALQDALDVDGRSMTVRVYEGLVADDVADVLLGRGDEMSLGSGETVLTEQVASIGGVACYVPSVDFWCVRPSLAAEGYPGELAPGVAPLSAGFADPYILGGDNSEGILEFVVAQRVPEGAVGGALELPGGEPVSAEVVRLGGSALAVARATAPAQDEDRALEEWTELMTSMDGFTWDYGSD